MFIRDCSKIARYKATANPRGDSTLIVHRRSGCSGQRSRWLFFNSPLNKRGQGMTEYIIIVALIAIAAIGILELLGGTVRIQFGKIAASLQGTEYSGGNFHEQGEIDARTKSKSLKDFDK